MYINADYHDYVSVNYSSTFLKDARVSLALFEAVSYKSFRTQVPTLAFPLFGAFR